MKEVTAKWMAITLAVWALFWAGCDRMPPDVAADVAVLAAGPQVVPHEDAGVDSKEQPSTEQEGGVPAGTVKTLNLPGGAEMEMVWCPPGSFWMGSPSGETGRKDDETRHRVTLTEGFWMAKTEVTQDQWASVMGKARGAEGESGDTPATYLEWGDCQEFCRKIGLVLPTEAQWEYACRAGSESPYSGTGKLDDMGWYGGNTTDLPHPPGIRGLSPVGKKSPNAWGLYDMHGNVEEWCADWYGEYPHGEQTNPRGPADGEKKVQRGGHNQSDPEKCRSASRSSWNAKSPFGGIHGFGFRPVSPSANFPDPDTALSGTTGRASLDEDGIRQLLEDADLVFSVDDDGKFTVPLEWLTGRTQNVTIRKERGESLFSPVWKVCSIGHGSFFGGGPMVPGGLRRFVEEDKQTRETGEWTITEHRDMGMWSCEFSVPLSADIDEELLHDIIAYVGETADELEQEWRERLGDVF